MGANSALNSFLTLDCLALRGENAVASSVLKAISIIGGNSVQLGV